MLIIYGTHYVSVPINIGQSVLQPMVDEVGGVAIHASQVEVPDEQLRHNLVKGTLRVEEQEIGRLLQCTDRMLDNFSHQ